MKHIWSLICNKAIVDESTNLISIIENIEEFKIQVDEIEKIRKEHTDLKKDIIILPIDFEIVSFWIDYNIKEQREANIKIELIDPSGKELNTYNFELNFPKLKKRMRTRFKILGFPFTKTGEYLFRIHLNQIGKKQETVAEVPVEAV